MAKRIPMSSPDHEIQRERPAATDEAREKQLCSLAIDLAEQQLRDGTASSQVIVHYLKLASSREREERELIQANREFVKAKTDGVKALQKSDEEFKAALNAFKGYTPHSSDEDDTGEYYE